jgi:hypothetical protein
MFTVYIDDSGTAPEQKVAISAGLIFPEKQLAALEREWNKFLKKADIKEFHTSACVHKNHHSAFASWDDGKVGRVVSRVRQISLKYSVRGFSCAISKDDHNDLVPDDLRRLVGQSHYSWAVSCLCGHVHDWARDQSVPLEYVFDTCDKAVKQEIEAAMDYSEFLYPGCFRGRYFFPERKLVPALQCADLYAWTNYQFFLSRLFSRNILPIAKESWVDYIECGGGGKYTWQVADRGELADWAKGVYARPDALALLRYWRDNVS